MQELSVDYFCYGCPSAVIGRFLYSFLIRPFISWERSGMSTTKTPCTVLFFCYLFLACSVILTRKDGVEAVSQAGDKNYEKKPQEIPGQDYISWGSGEMVGKKPRWN